MYYFYILYSKQLDSYYAGHTNNIESRIKKHLSNHKGYTAKAKDWILVFSENYTTKSEAYNRELEIKNWKSKNKIIQLINKISENELSQNKLSD